MKRQPTHLEQQLHLTIQRLERELQAKHLDLVEQRAKADYYRALCGEFE